MKKLTKEKLLDRLIEEGEKWPKHTILPLVFWGDILPLLRQIKERLQQKPSITWDQLVFLCDWEEQDASQYRKGPGTGGCGPMRYYIRPAAMEDRLKELGVVVEK